MNVKIKTAKKKKTLKSWRQATDKDILFVDENAVIKIFLCFIQTKTNNFFLHCTHLITDSILPYGNHRSVNDCLMPNRSIDRGDMIKRRKKNRIIYNICQFFH